MTVLAMARVLDDPRTTPNAKSECARTLLGCWETLAKSIPPTMEQDELDDLATRREARRNRSAAAPD